MDKLIPVTNTTAAPIFIGDRMLAPGDTRHFPESQVPAHLRLPAGHTSCVGLEAMDGPTADAPGAPLSNPQPAPENPLEAILAGSPDEIAVRLAEIHDTAVIGQLEDLELARDDECRKEVLGLLADRQFAIADARHSQEEAAREAAPEGGEISGDGSGEKLPPISQ